MQNWFGTLTHQGVNTDIPAREHKYIILLNSYVFLATVITIPYYIFALFIKTPYTLPIVLTLMVANVFWLLPIYLNRQGRYIAARLVYIISSYSFFIGWSLFMGKASGVHFFLVSGAIVTMFVFGPAYNKTRASLVFLCLASFFLIELFVYDVNKLLLPYQGLVMVVKTAVMVAFVLAVAAMLVYISIHYNRSEENLDIEKQKSENLLLNILPVRIADRLKAQPATIADAFDNASVLFSDIVGFTALAERLKPEKLVEVLNTIFSRFDDIAEKYHVEKIKTIGDAYMVAAGIPEPMYNHAHALCSFALEMRDVIQSFKLKSGGNLAIRIGVHSGPVVAGIIGKKKFSYDLWGDTVNTAARMESHGVENQVQISEQTYQLVKDDFNFTERGEVKIKGKGNMKVYLLLGHR